MKICPVCEKYNYDDEKKCVYCGEEFAENTESNRKEGTIAEEPLLVSKYQYTEEIFNAEVKAYFILGIVCLVLGSLYLISFVINFFIHIPIFDVEIVRELGLSPSIMFMVFAVLFIPYALKAKKNKETILKKYKIYSFFENDIECAYYDHNGEKQSVDRIEYSKIGAVRMARGEKFYIFQLRKNKGFFYIMTDGFQNGGTKYDFMRIVKSKCGEKVFKIKMD